MRLPCAIGRDEVLWSPANMGPLTLKRHVVTIHDAAAITHPEWFSKSFAAWYRFAWGRLSRNAMGILTVSEFSKNEICEALDVNPGKVFVAPNGSDHLNETVGSKPENWAQLLEPGFLLTVGSLQPRKNLRRLLEAWSRTKNPRKVRLVVIGDESSIYAAAGVHGLKNLEHVVFTGRVDDESLVWYYRNSMGFFSSTLYEGFDLPPLEALALGCPAFVSDIEVHREILGGTVLYFDAGDVDGIRQALELALCGEQKKRRKSKELEGLLKRLTWEGAAGRIKEIFRDVCAGGVEGGNGR
jgi:glycosyltransferase involved in cell wall biosynthesis